MRETHALGMADAVQLGADGAPVAAPAPSSGATVPFAEEAYLHRFVLDLAERRVVESAPLSTMASDFPAVHPAAVGRPGRYAFSAGVATGAGAPHAITLFDALLKHDLRNGGVTRRALRPGVLCGDVCYAPRVPGAPLSATSADGSDGSDDGHVLLLTHDVAAETAELLVLDARDICADPVATVHVPLRVPFGFHCEWVPGPLPLWETGGPSA
jgi:carotenoid cleavage dioxygenase